MVLAVEATAGSSPSCSVADLLLFVHVPDELRMSVGDLPQIRLEGMAKHRDPMGPKYPNMEYLLFLL